MRMTLCGRGSIRLSSLLASKKRRAGLVLPTRRRRVGCTQIQLAPCNFRTKRVYLFCGAVSVEPGGSDTCASGKRELALPFATALFTCEYILAYRRPCFQSAKYKKKLKIYMQKLCNFFGDLCLRYVMNMLQLYRNFFGNIKEIYHARDRSSCPSDKKVSC